MVGTRSRIFTEGGLRGFSLLLLIYTPAEVAAIGPFLVLTKFFRVLDREVFHIGRLLEAAAAFLCMPLLASIWSYEAPVFGSGFRNLLVRRNGS